MLYLLVPRQFAAKKNANLGATLAIIAEMYVENEIDKNFFTEDLHEINDKLGISQVALLDRLNKIENTDLIRRVKKNEWYLNVENTLIQDMLEKIRRLKEIQKAEKINWAKNETITDTIKEE